MCPGVALVEARACSAKTNIRSHRDGTKNTDFAIEKEVHKTALSDVASTDKHDLCTSLVPQYSALLQRAHLRYLQSGLGQVLHGVRLGGGFYSGNHRIGEELDRLRVGLRVTNRSTKSRSTRRVGKGRNTREQPSLAPIATRRRG